MIRIGLLFIFFSPFFTNLKGQGEPSQFIKLPNLTFSSAEDRVGTAEGREQRVPDEAHQPQCRRGTIESQGCSTEFGWCQKSCLGQKQCTSLSVFRSDSDLDPCRLASFCRIRIWIRIKYICMVQEGNRMGVRIRHLFSKKIVNYLQK